MFTLLQKVRDFQIPSHIKDFVPTSNLGSK
jgi:hypothetical protein